MFCLWLHRDQKQTADEKRWQHPPGRQTEVIRVVEARHAIHAPQAAKRVPALRHSAYLT